MKKVLHHHHHRLKQHKFANCIVPSAGLIHRIYKYKFSHEKRYCSSEHNRTAKTQKSNPQIIRVKTENFMIKILNGFLRHPKIFRLSGPDLICMTWSDLSSTFAKTDFFSSCRHRRPLSSDEANWIGLCLEIWLNNWTVAKTNKWWHNDSKLGLRFAKHDCGQTNNPMKRCMLVSANSGMFNLNSLKDRRWHSWKDLNPNAVECLLIEKLCLRCLCCYREWICGFIDTAPLLSMAQVAVINYQQTTMYAHQP